MTATVFDRPQWLLIPDQAGPRSYANVNNVLEIVRGRSVVRAPTVVNTALFTLMREVFKIDPAASCSLSLDEVSGYYVFSLYAGPANGCGEHLYDLWTYTAKTLPAWLLDRHFHL